MKAPPSERSIRDPLLVLHLRDTSWLCGPGKTILETVRGNRDPDISYIVGSFRMRSSNRFLAELADHCPTIELSQSRLLLPWTAWRLARYTRRKGVRLIHAHDFKTNMLAKMVASWTGLPVVTTVHGYIAISAKSRLYARIDRWLLGRMNLVVAVSEPMANELGTRRIPASRIRLIRNCIVLERYPFRYRSNAVLDDGSFAGHPLVGHIGRISREKGQEALLDAFGDVLGSLPDARLVFAGAGPDLHRLRRKSVDLGLDRVVRFLGHRSDILEVFGKLDLLVLNSETEGLPNVVLEAMALGVPVVATAVGGTCDLVTDGMTGLLVPPKNRAALAEAIVNALTDRAAATTRAYAARRFVEERFGMDTLIGKTQSMYRAVLRRE